MTLFSAKTRPLLAHEGTGFVGFGVGTGAAAGAGVGVAWDLGGLRTSLVTAEGGAGSAIVTLRESCAEGVETTRGDGTVDLLNVPVGADDSHIPEPLLSPPRLRLSLTFFAGASRGGAGVGTANRIASRGTASSTARNVRSASLSSDHRTS